MARRTAVRKKKTVRAARRVGGMKALPTDSWHSAKWYTHYEVEGREWGATVKDWIRENLDRKSIAAVNRLPDWRVSAFSHWATVAQLRKVKPEIIPEVYNIRFDEFVAALVADGTAIAQEKRAQEAEKSKVHTPSIQERIREQAQAACEDIEQWLEGYVTAPSSFDPSGFDFAAHFAKHKVTQAHARKIKRYYAGWRDEAEAVANMPTAAAIKKIKDTAQAEDAAQLREGYAHVKKADAKRWLEALDNLIGALDMVIEESKVKRKPRAKKAPSKEKLVAKIKYKERDDAYQLVSVNPVEMVGASEIWVFNTKTRKLGKYVADEYAGQISVKGASLIGFDQDRSVQKNLRKPEDALKEFKKAGKVKLRRFLEEITAVEIKLNGRLNTETVILKVVK